MATRMYNACIDADRGAGQTVASAKATWLSMLRTAVRQTSPDLVSKQDWIRSLAQAMQSASVDWVPGEELRRISAQCLFRLTSAAPAANAGARALPGSLKRAALQAEEDLRKPVAPAQRRVIDFGCAVPFTEVPRRIEEEFRKLESAFRNRAKSQGVIEHYRLAYRTLSSHLGEPYCDLLLMLVLTLAASAQTVHVAEGERRFALAGRQKDADQQAAVMATRMLWFLDRTAFPWKADTTGVATVEEMTKKLGTCKMNNIIPRTRYRTNKALYDRAYQNQQPVFVYHGMDSGHEGAGRQSSDF
jgi:hypothetical protein